MCPESRVLWQSLTLPGHSTDVRSIAFSLDGKWIVSGSGGSRGWSEKVVKLWNAATGAEVRNFECCRFFFFFVTLETRDE